LALCITSVTYQIPPTHSAARQATRAPARPLGRMAAE
jgi:hypothetical protein